MKGTMLMKKTIREEGFTLVELLVVIAIIALLASALFPAINGAMNQARATALKNKGRGVWTAVLSANMEREPLNLDSVWPADLMGDDAADDSKISGNTADAYFSYLLSAGESTSDTTIEGDADSRVVSDLTPESITAQGIPAAAIGSSVEPKNCAWHVLGVNNSTPGEMPFMITKNVDISGSIQQVQDDKTTKLASFKADTDPFRAARAVWVTRGGSVADARPKFFTKYTVLGEGTNEVDVFTCEKGN